MSRHWMLRHPLSKHLAMFVQSIFIPAFDGKITHFATVGLHIIEHFAIFACFVQYIFVVRCTHHPSSCTAGLKEVSFRYYIGLVFLLRVSAFNHSAETGTLASSG